MSKDDIPTSAKQKAVDLANAEYGGHIFHLKDVTGTLRAFARYIAAHEEKPVDPLLLEAREICAQHCDEAGRHRVAKACRSGTWDNMGNIQNALATLRRGVEIGRAEAAAADAEGAKQ